MAKWKSDFALGWRVVLAICVLLAFAGAARAEEPHPLQPVPTSNPRETLAGFIDTTSALYRARAKVIESYAASGRLYLNADEWAILDASAALFPRAVEALDTSRLSPALKDIVATERAAMLREVLDRIDLPAPGDVPDQAEMTRLGLKKWRLPNTEIDIVLIEKGPRAGEYLVSAATVDRLPEFYARVKDLPEKSDVARGLLAALIAVNPDHAGTIYDAFLHSPLGLARVVPVGWLLRTPAWAKASFFGLALWQWAGLGAGLTLAALLLILAHRLKRSLKRLRSGPASPRWHTLVIPIAVIVVAGAWLPAVFGLFHLGGPARVILAYARTAILYLAAAWLVLASVNLVVDLIVVFERIKTRSLDSQLLRLGARIIGVLGASAVLIRGADDLGVPAYSVMAGLGVGGLAVALAARDSVANLLGSILIMFEKPFRVGHLIRISGNLGTVENVGFRSTRIRTLDNTLISIPNNSVVNTTVENLTLRPQRRQRLLVQVTYDTPCEKLEALMAGVRRMLVELPFVDSTNFHVRFNDFGESSLNILVIVHLITTDYGQELQFREEILMRILDLATQLQVEFAFPTRTLHLEAAPNPSPEPPVSRWGFLRV